MRNKLMGMLLGSAIAAPCVEALTQDDLRLRGLRTMPEAVAGNVPGDPAVVSLRGFSGNAVSVLQDGVRMR